MKKLVPLPKRIFGPPPEERGGVAVIAAFMMLVFLGMTSLAIDLGNVFKVKAELQRAADAGALAGIIDMFPPGAAKNCAGALTTAQNFTQTNLVDGQSLEAARVSTQFGYWALPHGPFTPSSCEQANAVQVNVNKKLDMFFAAVLGVKTMQPTAQAIAISKVTGSLPVGGAFPFAIDKSRVPPNGTAGTIYINSNGSDYGCWTSFFDPPGKVKDYLSGDISSPTLKVGDVINVKNGVDTPELKLINDRYQNATVTVPVIPDGEHSGTTSVLGFARVQIIRAGTPGGGSLSLAPGGGQDSWSLPRWLAWLAPTPAYAMDLQMLARRWGGKRPAGGGRGGSGNKFVSIKTFNQFFTEPNMAGGGNTNYNLGTANGSTLVQ